jgi:hypothetical protein
MPQFSRKEWKNYGADALWSITPVVKEAIVLYKPGTMKA